MPPVLISGSHIKTPQNSLLSHSTTMLMLTPVVEDVHKSKNKPLPLGYSLGWFVQKEKEGLLTGKRHPFYFGHSGGAVGASSILLVMPNREKEGDKTMNMQEASEVCSTVKCITVSGTPDKGHSEKRTTSLQRIIKSTFIYTK